MWRKNRTVELDPDSSLSLPLANGKPALSFSSEVIEQIRYMLARMQQNARIPSRLAVVSALRQEGVTFTSLALATVLAHDYKANVCVVDLNWHWPSKNELLASSDQNLVHLMGEGRDIKAGLRFSGWPNLALMPAGKVDPSKRAILARSKTLQEMVYELSFIFNYLILDTPAILSTSDAVPLASLAESCVLVVRQGSTQKNDVSQALNEIRHIPVMGIVLNRAHYATPAPLRSLFANR
jgi:Mrp family chromosome partitioning ATPase